MSTTITHNSDSWTVLRVGVAIDGKNLVCLESTTQGHETKHGWYRKQDLAWIDTDKLREAGVLQS